MRDHSDAPSGQPTLDDEVWELLRRARDGDNQAAQELFDDYSPLFLKVIRRKLARRLRTIFDSNDFLQEARLALIADRPSEAYASLDAFISFLSGIAENKVLMANRKYLDYRRNNLKREVPLDGTSGDANARHPRQPSTFDTVACNERWQQLLDSLPLVHRRIAVLLREGHTQNEIAGSLKINERTVRRVVKRISTNWDSENDISYRSH